MIFFNKILYERLLIGIGSFFAIPFIFAIETGDTFHLFDHFLLMSYWALILIIGVILGIQVLTIIIKR